jgi:hypothetical protein
MRLVRWASKANDTWNISLDDPIAGFTTTILHTAELVAKNPTGKTGHPEIVIEQLTHNNDPNPLFVQFTANSNPSGSPFGFNATGDGSPTHTAFNGGAHDMATSHFEDWVSAHAINERRGR